MNQSTLLLFTHMDMCACSSIHGRWRIVPDLLTFPSVRTENINEQHAWANKSSKKLGGV